MNKMINTVLLSCVVSTSLFAAHNRDFWRLHVHINNVGSEHCYLKDAKYQGELIGVFPARLPATGESQEFMIDGGKSMPMGSLSSTLTYHCGKYKKFTIQMSQYYTPENGDRAVTAEMVDAVDVFEHHSVVYGDIMMGGVGNSLVWEINH